VCAIGGGPGFEHVALCSFAAFMASVQGVVGQQVQPRSIHTTLFDLYADHWREKMNLLNAAQQQHVSQHSQTQVDTLALDLRTTFGQETQLDRFDLFLMCYVLHENAAFIIDPNNQNDDINDGCIKDIMVQAKSGAVILCCDASNRLWPIMTTAAHKYGWDVETNPHKSMLRHGPKSCWFAVKK